MGRDPECLTRYSEPLPSVGARDAEPLGAAPPGFSPRFCRILARAAGSGTKSSTEASPSERKEIKQSDQVSELRYSQTHRIRSLVSTGNSVIS